MCEQHSIGIKKYGLKNDGSTHHFGAPSVPISRPAPVAIEVKVAAIQYEHAGAAANWYLGGCLTCRVDGRQKSEVCNFQKTNSRAGVLHFISLHITDNLLLEHSILALVAGVIILTEAECVGGVRAQATEGACH